MIIVTIFLTFLFIILALILALFILCFIASRRPAVENDYFNQISSCMPIEQKYTAKGDYHVSYFEAPSEYDYVKKYEIWYPSEILLNDKSNRKYPLVIMANGTGIMASRYKAIFDHLASWGFIVVGNENENSGNGKSSSACLDYMISLNSNKENQFYEKIDLDNIAVAGHSQGGLGAINAVLGQKNGDKYKTIYTASAPTNNIAEFILKVPYNDMSKLQIPYFQTSGTLKIDAGVDENSGISPLSSLEERFNLVSEKVPKILARRVNTDHGNMLPKADGYMTAWLSFWLQNDLEAKKAFFGTDAEILINPNWTDIKKNI